MQLHSLAKSTEALNKITSVLNNTELSSIAIHKELETIGKSYTTETLKAAIAQSTLKDRQIETILSANGLQDELLETTVNELANATNTNLVAESQAGTTVTTLGLGTAFKGLGILIKKATTSMIAWMTTNPVGWVTTVIAAIGAAIYGVTKLHDLFTVSLEEQKEKLQETKETYENVKNELQEVESELQNVQNKIKELENTPTLTWIEHEELNRLREITKELELQKQLKQDEQLKSAEDLYKENEKTFNKEFESSYGNTSVDDLKQQLATRNIGIGQLDYENITDTIAALQYLREEKSKLVDEREIEEYDEFISDLTNSIKSNGQEYLSSLSEYKQNILEIASIRNLTEDEQIFYDYLSSMQKMIYEFYSPATWNNLELDSIFNTEGIEKTKEELVQMYKSGELSSAEMLETFPRLNQAIKESEIIVGECSDVFEEIFNEIAALAEEQANMVNGSAISFSTALTSSKDSIDKFQSSVKSAADAYTTLLTGTYSSSELLDSIQAINQAAFDMGESIDWESIGSIEDLDKAIQSVSDTYLDSFLNDNNINPDSNFAKMLQNVVNEIYHVETAYDAFNNSIDTIQSSYKTLNDAIAEYNQNGYVTLDTLQSVLEIDNKYLSCLMDENGKLTLNEEMYEKLTLARLDDAKNTIIQEGIQELENIALENSVVASDKAGESASDHGKKLNTSIKNIQKHTKAVMDDSAAVAANNEVLEGGTIDDLDMAYQKALAVNEKAANDSMSAIKAKLAFVDSVASNTVSNFNNISGAASGSSSATSEFSETIDFFERRVEVLDDALSHLKSSLDNVTGSFGKNNLIDAELGVTEEKFNNYTDALAMYTQKANEAFSKIPADIASTVKDGAVSLTDFIGDNNKDVVEAIKEYESWTDKITDCTQELTELKTAIRQLELEKFNNIMDDFSNQFDLRGDSKDLISKQIDLLKESGKLIGESFFTAQIDQSKKQLELLENEKTQLINQLSSAINSGRIQAGTEEWLEMVNALSDVDGSILDCQKSIEEFDNSLLELHTEIFNRIQEQFSNLDSEISNILDLFDEFEVSDDKGIWSKEGIAQLGLLAQQYELAQYQVQQYNNEIDELNKQYLAGRYSATEYADKLADLSSAQWDAVKSTESAKDSIMDLNETRIENQIKGIEKEIEAYKELTDAQIEALKASKDLHDYEKSIAEKTKSITDLERQIAAMQNDTSAATIAKRKKLEEQLAEAKKDLEETEYDHSIEVQEDALNKQYESYEKERNEEIDALRESLNDKEAILAESFEIVKENASVVGQEIATIATEHGITVSNALISSWQSGENAIASYGKVLSQSTSAFIQNIMGVENEVWNLQAQANTTADSLAWMFSAKADNLVNELYMSYYAETTLADMTNALQQSLVNTLERGYDASGIVNSLNSIADAADRAKRKIDSLNGSSTVPDNTPQNVNPKYEVYTYNTGKVLETLDHVPTIEEIETIGSKYIGYNGISKLKVRETYASGTRNARKGLRVINEEGSELVLPKLPSGNYAVGNAGDQILTKAETDNIFKWAKFDPKDFTPVNMAEHMNNLRAMSMPSILPNNVNNNSVNVHYDSMVTVNGDVNDTNHFIKQISTVAEQAITNAVKTAEKTRKYGMI